MAAHGDSPSVRPPVVGVVGGGQLARMMAAPAAALGITLRLLTGSATDSAAQVIAELTLGDERDLETLRRFASGCDVLTFDHEHVPGEHLLALEAAGVAVRPGAAALLHAQDKIVLRQRLDCLGLPQPAWRAVDTPEQVEQFAAEHGWPVVLKTARGGYDGKGVWRLDDAQQAREGLRQAQASAVPLLAEAHVAFRRELAAQVARRPNGQIEVFPAVETVQKNGICHQVLAPAPQLDEPCAQAIATVATTVAHKLGVVGMLAVELFDTGNPSQPVLVNELAMRPHNSGHWSIDGASVSQFEQHLRAVLDWPLAPVHTLHPAAVMVNLLGAQHQDLPARAALAWQREPSAHLHLYGKSVKPGRKVGHVTLCGDEVTQLRSRCQDVAAAIIGASSA